MKLQLVTMMTACLVVARGAAAGEMEQNEAWNRHRGFYAEANFGTGWGYFFNYSGFDGFAWIGAVGYSFTPHHAIEGGFGQWYESDKDEGDAGYINAGYLAWRGTIPIMDRFALFGKLGIAGFDDPDGGGAGAPFGGLGLSYAVTPQIDVSLQFQGASAVLAGGGALTLGAAYHF
jgi:hypothetical protein